MSGGQYILKKGVAQLSDLVDGGLRYPGNYENRVYYVNNITGHSGNDGLSWGDAFAEPSQAITAWAAYLLTLSTNNRYVRGVIYIQGTATAYAALTSLPSYCDVVGIGADPRGNGSGITRIHNDSNGDCISHGSSGVRGLHMENIQVSSAATGSITTGYSMDLAKIFRSTFNNCVFWNKSTGGVRVTIGGGVHFRHCDLGGGDGPVTPNKSAIGFNQDGAANFNNCTVENCYIYGGTTGIALQAVAMGQTLIQNNFIYGGTTGILDTQDNKPFYDLPMYLDNRIFAVTDCISIINNGTTKSIGNLCNTNGTITREGSIS